MIEPLLLTATQISTFDGDRLLTKASGFFFARDERLFLVTSRHVVLDPASRHHPNRIEIELHLDAVNLTRSTNWSVLLYQNGKSVWRHGRDSAGDIDVAVIEINRAALPPSVQLRAFTPEHLPAAFDEIEVGTPVLILGFPLGFHDTLHHLPVVRQAVIASSYGLRFQGQGYFLSDGRTHRGTSGSPVVMREALPAADAAQRGGLPWKLLGVHSARLDMRTRDLQQDESLGLNSAWYADILMTLTEAGSPLADAPMDAAAADAPPLVAGPAMAPVTGDPGLDQAAGDAATPAMAAVDSTALATPGATVPDAPAADAPSLVTTSPDGAAATPNPPLPDARPPGPGLTTSEAP